MLLELYEIEITEENKKNSLLFNYKLQYITTIKEYITKKKNYFIAFFSILTFFSIFFNLKNAK